MASSSHVSNIDVTVLLQALATPAAGFGTVTLLVDEAQGTGNGLNTDSTPTQRYVDFASYAEAQAAQTAGEISAEVLAACLVAFSQPGEDPEKFRVARVDTGAAETYSSAFALLLAEEGVQGDIYGLCMDSRAGADQEAFEATVAATGRYLLYLQTAEADAITSGFPAAMTDMEESAIAGGVYHDTSTEWADVAAAVRLLTWDPDEVSAPGENDLGGVAEYATFLTESERAFATANNLGVIGTWGSTDFWLSPMLTFDGRPVYERLTADWLHARIQERIQTLVQREHQAGRKILVTPTGQRQVGAAIGATIALGEQVGHFAPGQVTVTYPTITDADRTARRLAVVVQGQIGISAIHFDFNVNLSTTPVVE